MLGWFNTKWICWFYSVLFATINLKLLAVCYQIDYQNACKRGSIHLPDDNIEDQADVLISFREGPWIESDINQVGVKIHTQNLKSFRKPYYLIVLFTWITFHITVCVVGSQFLRLNIQSPEIYGILTSIASAPVMALAAFLVALFRWEVKFLWNYEENWQLTAESTTNPEENVGQTSTHLSGAQSPPDMGKPSLEGKRQIMKSLILWVQDTQVVSCLSDVFCI